MRLIIKLVVIMGLLAAGFAAGYATGFPVGKNAGFDTGSEWALVQAEIVARESGLYMPVALDNGQFRIVLKQPNLLYRRAWRLADMHEETEGREHGTVACRGEGPILAKRTVTSN